MENNPRSSLVTAQEAAIQEARARYERGDLSFEDFHRALDAIVLARDGDECRIILNALPSAPLAPLNALDRPNLPIPSTPSEPHARIVAFMGQTKKTRRAWQLAPSAEAVAFMGEVKLDLRRAEMPARARLQVTAVMGSVLILVPRNVRVSVNSTVLLSDTNLLGEGVSGVIGSGHERHDPTGEPAISDIEIEVFALMSNVKVILVDESSVSVNELVREALRAVVSGVRQGLQQARDPRALPGAYGE